MVKPVHFLLANVFASDFARGIVRVALGWVVLEQNGAAGLSFFVLVTSLGQFFGSMLAGHFTDTYDKKTVAFIVTSLSAIGILALAGTFSVFGQSLALLCFLSAAVHFALSIQDNATRTLIPTTVGEQDIERANAQFITVGEFGFFIAPLLAGYWTSFYGPTGVLFVAAFIAFVGAGAVAGISPAQAEADLQEELIGQATVQKLKISEYRWLYFGIILAMAANFLLVPISYVLVPIAIESEGLTAVELGYFYAAMSVGLAAVGFLKAEKLGASLASWQMPIFICLGAMTYLAIFAFQHVYAIVLCGVLAGFFLAKFEVAWNGIIQRESPAKLLGRIYAFGSWTSFAARSSGVFLVGLVVSSADPSMIVALLIAVTLTTVPAVALIQGRLIADSG